MIGKKSLLWVAGFTMVLLLIVVAGSVQAQGGLTPQEELGKFLFFDTNLSDPAGQSCAVCHGPTVGWTGPDSAINAGGAVYEGAVPGRFGNRKPPAAAYAGDSPILYYDGDEMGRRHVLGRPGHRLDPRRSPGRTGPGAVPEPRWSRTTPARRS